MSTDVGWLAGIIDGEGSLALTTRKKAIGFWPVLFIYNSSQPMLDKATRVIRSLGVEPAPIKPRVTSGLSKKKVAGIHVNHALPVVLCAVLPHLVTEKRAFAAALLELDAMRLRNSLWTPVQVEFALRIRAAHMPRTNRVSGALVEALPSVLDSASSL